MLCTFTERYHGKEIAWLAAGSDKKVAAGAASLGKWVGSGLRAALLSLWAHHLSLACWESSPIDGLPHDELAVFAKCGHHRDYLAISTEICIFKPAFLPYTISYSLPHIPRQDVGSDVGDDVGDHVGDLGA